MKPLGNDLLGNINEEVPYSDKYIPPYEYTPAYDRPAYREEGIFPLQRPPTSPQLPYTTPRYLIPPSQGPKYVQGPIGNIVPATHSPYPLPGIIPDKEIIKILVSKNLFNALSKRGLPTMAARRYILDFNTKRAIENEVHVETMNDIDLVARGDFRRIQITEGWQREAIRENLLDTAALHNIMMRIVGIQVWPSKEGNAWPMELKRAREQMSR